MAQIYNSDLSKEMASSAGIQLSRDSLPNQLAEKVVPVMEVNPKLLRRSRVLTAGRINNATGGTLMTTDASRDTFITSGVFSFIKDVTSTATQLQLRVTIDGAVVRLVELASLTLTAHSGAISFSLPTPVKVDRNTAISLASDTNVANFQISATVHGYVVDTSNA